MRLLLAEDEDSLRRILKVNLEMEAFEVITAETGKEALKLFNEQHFDLIILDVMMPEIDGFQVLQQIRLTNLKIPVPFLTAKNTAEDRIIGLKTGADDYLTKPFSFEELILRINNILKRAAPFNPKTDEVFRFGNNEVNFSTYEATTNDGKIKLTKREIMLLKLLIDKRNEVVSRQQILQFVWGYDVYPTTRTIDNFILSFRKYFEEDPSKPRLFMSVRGVGYKLVM